MGRWKMEEGRGKREEFYDGRCKREEGRGKKEEGRCFICLSNFLHFTSFLRLSCHHLLRLVSCIYALGSLQSLRSRYDVRRKMEEVRLQLHSTSCIALRVFLLIPRSRCKLMYIVYRPNIHYGVADQSSRGIL